MDKKKTDYGNIPEEEVQCYKTWLHTARGCVAKDISNTMRISQDSALRKLNSSVCSGSLRHAWKVIDGRYSKLFYPTEDLKDRIQKIESGDNK
jgi:hypothetical protein